MFVYLVLKIIIELLFNALRWTVVADVGEVVSPG